MPESLLRFRFAGITGEHADEPLHAPGGQFPPGVHDVKVLLPAGNDFNRIRLMVSPDLLGQFGFLLKGKALFHDVNNHPGPHVNAPFHLTGPGQKKTGPESASIRISLFYPSIDHVRPAATAGATFLFGQVF
jgi:hypothetical protein